MMRNGLKRLLLLVLLLLIFSPASATVATGPNVTEGTKYILGAHAVTLVVEAGASIDTEPRYIVGALGILVGTSSLFLNRVLSDESAHFMNFVSLVEIGVGTFIIVKSRRIEASRVSLHPVYKLRHGEAEIGLALNFRF